MATARVPATPPGGNPVKLTYDQTLRVIDNLPVGVFAESTDVSLGTSSDIKSDGGDTKSGRRVDRPELYKAKPAELVAALSSACRVCLSGMVTRIRAMNRRLSFVDMHLYAPGGARFAGLINIVVRIEVMSESHHRDAMHEMNVGDEVDVEGFLRRPRPWTKRWVVPEMVAAHIRVTRAWADAGRGRFSQSYVRDRLSESVMSSTRGKYGEKGGKMDPTKPPPLCSHWLSAGKCQRPYCIFRHKMLPGEDRAAIKKAMIREKNRRRLNAPSTHGDSVDPSKKLPHSQRAGVFVRWLEQTYGRALLEKGVLDVAGGRGLVAVEAIIRGLRRCVVVDPRPMRIFRRDRRRISKAIGVPLDDNASLLTASQRTELFGKRFVDSNKELVNSVGIFVGMHPDEATEPILDNALRLQKPFAIVPCCVFSYENQHRRTPEGNLVTSYEDFVAYLLRKAPFARRAFLNFHGKNQVIYTLPQDYKVETANHKRPGAWLLRSLFVGVGVLVMARRLCLGVR